MNVGQKHTCTQGRSVVPMQEDLIEGILIVMRLKLYDKYLDLYHGWLEVVPKGRIPKTESNLKSDIE